MRIEYSREEADGWSEWETPADGKTMRIACCDCGLVHDWEFKVEGGVLQFRARRNNRSTAGTRRVPHLCRPPRRRA